MAKRMIEVTDFSSSTLDRMAGGVRERVVDAWGKEWKRMLSVEMQRAIVDAEVMALAARWDNAHQITVADLQRVRERAHVLIFGV